MYGSVAGTCTNIGAAIACGLFSGFLAALFYNKLYPVLNNNGVKDSFGMVLIVIVSFLSTFFIAPIVIAAYYNSALQLSTLIESSNSSNKNIITNFGAAGYALAYVAISFFIGIFSGIVTGILLKLVDRFGENEIFNDKLIFSKEHGLRNIPE